MEGGWTSAKGKDEGSGSGDSREAGDQHTVPTDLSSQVGQDSWELGAVLLAGGPGHRLLLPGSLRAELRPTSSRLAVCPPVLPRFSSPTGRAQTPKAPRDQAFANHADVIVAATTPACAGFARLFPKWSTNFSTAGPLPMLFCLECSLVANARLKWPRAGRAEFQSRPLHPPASCPPSVLLPTGPVGCPAPLPCVPPALRYPAKSAPRCFLFVSVMFSFFLFL